mmetsp:Transcript_2392/g.6031  ORF Transcript_2392/g.6031 Transcript_2392/m.6031 type:complete len:271 (+) Transcript_2392:333-1145(+)
MLEHASHLVVRIVDHDVEAGDGVVLAADGLEVEGDELGLDGGGDPLGRNLVALAGLLDHHGGDVAGGDLRALERHWDGEGASAAAAVADGLPLEPAEAEPVQRYVDGLGVAVPDPLLDAVDVLGLVVVDAPPALEPFAFEVVADGAQLVAARLHGHVRPPLLRVRDLQDHRAPGHSTQAGHHGHRRHPAVLQRRRRHHARRGPAVPPRGGGGVARQPARARGLAPKDDALGSPRPFQPVAHCTRHFYPSLNTLGRRNSLPSTQKPSNVRI